jgi:hypothetical protein
MCAHSSSLDFDSGSPLVTEDMLLDQLADILVDIFLEEEDARYKEQKGSDLLPGIDKGAG